MHVLVGPNSRYILYCRYIAQLHGSCDFLLENFDVRREARSGEIDAIKKAKAVLSGADYSFVQVTDSIPELLLCRTSSV